MLDTDTRANLAAEDAYELLSHNRRRRVIVAIAEADDPLSVSELTDLLVGAETGLPPRHVDAGTRRAIRIDLISCQLPKLQDADVLQERDPGYVADENLPGLLAAADAAAPHLA